MTNEGGDADGLDQEKTVEVRIPLRQLIELHSVKALTGRSLDDQVAEALSEHLAAAGPGEGPQPGEGRGGLDLGPGLDPREPGEGETC